VQRPGSDSSLSFDSFPPSCFVMIRVAFENTVFKLLKFRHFIVLVMGFAFFFCNRMILKAWNHYYMLALISKQ